MYSLVGKRGAWLNQYAVPTLGEFAERSPHVDYLIIKATEVLEPFADRLGEIGKPWLAEIYPYQSNAAGFGAELGRWMQKAACVGGVLNFEDEDTEGDWDSATAETVNAVFAEVEARSALPLYASLDTRGERPNDIYQLICCDRCVGVMPMVYPKQFGQSVADAFASAITALMGMRWSDKLIVPTIQTFNEVGSGTVNAECLIAAKFDGYTAYTLGHATDDEWGAFAGGKLPHEQEPEPVPPSTPTGDAALALIVDKLIVPLIYGRADVALVRGKLLYRLAHRTMPKDW